MRDVSETLQISFEVDLARYKRVWLEDTRAVLPKMLAFWGTSVVFSLLLWIAFPDAPFFIWFAILVAAIPCLNTLWSYQNYTAHFENMLKILSPEERIVSMIFRSDEDWFEMTNGKNYSRLSWESVKGVVEKNTYFLFQLGTTPYPIPKDAFQSESDRQLLRMIVTTKLGDNVKLLK